MLAQPGAGAIEQPEPAEGVFDEVADDPVWGEELGDGGDVLCGHGALAGHDCVLPLGDVELVEPAEDLDIGALSFLIIDFHAIGVADLGAEAVDDGVLGEDVIGQEQLGFVVEFLEEVWQQGVVEAAGGKDEGAIDLALRIRRRDAAVEEVIEPGGVGVGLQFLRQGSRAGELEQFGLRLVGGGRGEDAGAKRMPAPGVHETERGEAVEPCVGDALDEPSAVCLGELPEGGDLRREGGEVVGRLCGEDVVELTRDGLHDLLADRRGESFESGSVHSGMESYLEADAVAGIEFCQCGGSECGEPRIEFGFGRVVRKAALRAQF